MKKKCLILLSLVVALIVVWFSIRRMHFMVLQNTDSVVQWTNEGDAWFWRRPTDVDLNEDSLDPILIGSALNYYSSARKVTLRRNTKKWLDLLFSKWRNHQSLNVLFVMYSDLNDSHMAVLSGSDFTRIVFNNNQISGEIFPLSLHLQYLEFNGTPITDKGLKNVAAKCPMIENLRLYETKVTPAGVLGSGILRHPTLKQITISGLKIAKSEQQHLMEHGSRLNPGLRIYFE